MARRATAPGDMSLWHIAQECGWDSAGAPPAWLVLEATVSEPLAPPAPSSPGRGKQFPFGPLSLSYALMAARARQFLAMPTVPGDFWMSVRARVRVSQEAPRGRRSCQSCPGQDLQG